MTNFHTLVFAATASLVLFGILLFGLWRIAKDWEFVTFEPPKQVRDAATGRITPTGGLVDFDPRHGHYLKIAEVIITIASASLVFISTVHTTKTVPLIGFPIVLLGFS